MRDLTSVGCEALAARIALCLGTLRGGAVERDDVHVPLVEAEGGAVGPGRGDLLTCAPPSRLRDDWRCGRTGQTFVRPAPCDRGFGARLLGLCEDQGRAQDLACRLMLEAPRAARLDVPIGYKFGRAIFERL